MLEYEGICMSESPKSLTLFDKIYRRKWSFLIVFTFVYFLTLLGLGVFGLTPWSGSVTFNNTPVLPLDGNDSVAVSKGEGELPVRVEIPKLGIRASVSNPDSTNVAALDTALLSGAVRYPGSAVPGEVGNVLLFGHSSRLPVVQNQAFKAFNDIQNLEKGDPVFVIGEDKVYIYAVEKVEEANTGSDAINLRVEGAKLTLATCNNFGTKEDRFIVTATLVKIEDIPESAP
jgi:sortase A